MADKEVTVKVTTETDISSLEELDAKLDEIADKEGVEVTVDADSSSVEEATDKTTELEDELSNVDGTVVTPEVDTSSIDDAKGKLDETASSMDNLTTAAAGLAATAGVEQMAVTADNINTSWNRLDLTFQGTGVSMDTLKEKATSAGAATGRSGGVIRDYFNQMGIAGVTNAQLLESSFEALSGKAYQTGNSVEAMEGKLQRMVMTGNASGMMLQKLGIDTQDLANAMGVSADQVSEAFKSMTPEERLQAITKAMGDGARANDMYKNSYQGLKDQANAAMAGLMGAVGQAILPVVVPALQAATNAIKFLTDCFKALPGPVQAIIGGIGGFAAIAVTAVGVLGVFGNIITTVKTGLTALRSITILSEIATKAAAAAQWLLNIAMDANPVMLVVLAIIALIAVLGYLYFNNEQVRAAIDGLGQTFMWIAQIIYSTIVAAIQWVSDQFNSFTSQLGLNTSNWTQAILGFILFLPTLPMRVAAELANTIAKALGFKGNFVQTLWNTARDAVTNFANAIQGIPQALQNCLQWAYNIVMNHPLVQALKWLGEQAANAFSVLGLGQSSPGKIVKAMKAELDWTLEAIEKSSLPGASAGLGSTIADSFNPNLEFGNGSGVGNGGAGQVVNFYFSDIVVDDDKRMQRIVDYITRELNFDNATAGRWSDI